MLGQERTILVVDDTPINIDILRSILKNRYRIKVAISGKQALAVVEKNPQLDLILLDVMMPEMDGYEVCKRLKLNPLTAAIPVIFVTAMGEVEDEAHGFDVGAVDYIHKPVNEAIVLKRVATHLSLVRSQELDDLARSAIKMLGEAGHYNDTDTGEHIWRMAAYAKALASAAGWSDEAATILELAAPMHDMGKIGIPDSILKAPRKLTTAEWDLMKNHSQIGFEILSQSDNPIFKLAAEIALSHHERWDGQGYPAGLSENEIPISAQIVALADVFDALTMKRPYKKPWSIADALQEIERNAGTEFNPMLAKIFVSLAPQLSEIHALWDIKASRGES